MRYDLRFPYILLACASALTATGCSALGLSSPSHQLLPAAKKIRDLSAVPAPVPRELNPALHPQYVVMPGDTLLVQPAEFDAPVQLPPDQTVLADGTIDLGVYGRPVVAGKRVPEIEAEIQAMVNARAKAKEPIVVTARLIGRTTKVFYVLGEVNAPGAFPITGSETVLDALIAAGGLTGKGSEQNIILSRPSPPDGCRSIYPVCYSDIVQLADTTTNYQLMPGDRIFVPGRSVFEDILPAGWRKPRTCNRVQFGCRADGTVSEPIDCGPLPIPGFRSADRVVPE